MTNNTWFRNDKWADVARLHTNPVAVLPWRMDAYTHLCMYVIKTYFYPICFFQVCFLFITLNKYVYSISQCIIIRTNLADPRWPVLLRLPLKSFSLFDATVRSWHKSRLARGKGFQIWTSNECSPQPLVGPLRYDSLPACVFIYSLVIQNIILLPASHSSFSHRRHQNTGTAITPWSLY
jgi:hypothetical protein